MDELPVILPYSACPALQEMHARAARNAWAAWRLSSWFTPSHWTAAYSMQHAAALKSSSHHSTNAPHALGHVALGNASSRARTFPLGCARKRAPRAAALYKCVGMFRLFNASRAARPESMTVRLARTRELGSLSRNWGQRYMIFRAVMVSPCMSSSLATSYACPQRHSGK